MTHFVRPDRWARCWISLRPPDRPCKPRWSRTRPGRHARDLPVLAPRVAGIDRSGGCAGRRRGLPLARRTAVLALATTSATLLLQRVPVRYPTGVLTGSIAPVGYRIRPSLSSLYRDNRCHSTLITRLIAIRAAIHQRAMRPSRVCPPAPEGCHVTPQGELKRPTVKSCPLRPIAAVMPCSTRCIR